MDLRHSFAANLNPDGLNTRLIPIATCPIRSEDVHLGALTPIEFAQLKTENLIPPPAGEMATDSTYELLGIAEQTRL